MVQKITVDIADVLNSCVPIGIWSPLGTFYFMLCIRKKSPNLDPEKN